MKFLSVRVDDLRLEDDPDTPILVVDIDEPLLKLGEEFDITYPVPAHCTQYGAFWDIDYTDSESTLPIDDILGHVNTKLHAKLVPVEVGWPGENLYHLRAFPVDRARQLLRRFGLDYQYMLSDSAARQRRIQWNLERDPMSCIDCSGAVDSVIDIFGIQYPACNKHAPIFRAKARDLRLQRKVKNNV